LQLVVTFGKFSKFLGKLCMIPDQMQQSWTPIDKAFIEVQWAEKVMENEPGKVL